MTAAAIFFQMLDFQAFVFQKFDLQSLDLQSFAQVSSARMVNCTVEGIGIALLAWILLRALGRQNSHTRFSIWFSALVGIAALPLVGHFGTSGSEMVKQSEIVMPASWARYIFAGWALIATAGLARIVFGFWRLRQLRDGCVPVDAATLDPLLRKTLEEFDSPRPVCVCVSAIAHVPTAVGFIKPLIIIPPWTMQKLSATELNAILLHELAHLRRWDDWTNLLQKVLGALLFFHPAVWWIDKRLSLEREMACDDLVLARTGNPRGYAECLVSLAERLAERLSEKSLLRRGVDLAQAAVGRVRHISLRVVRILDEKRPGATRVWRPAPVLLAGLSLACLMLLSDVPRLVSFENSPATSVVGSDLALMAPGSDVDPIPLMESQVVPTRFMVKPEAKTTMAAAETKKTKPRRSVVVPAKASQRPLHPPMLFRSSASQEDANAPQTLILIMQTGRYDSSGSVVWDWCVWRVTVMGSAQDRMQSGIVVQAI